MIVNPYLVGELKAAGLWAGELAEQLKAHDGDLTEIASIPAELKHRYRTAFQLPAEALIDAAARRQKWIDQSQSLNLFLPAPDMRSMSHMYRRAWHAGLKTTYYLRTLAASSVEKATIAAPAAAREDARAPVAVAGAELDPIACSIAAIRAGGECEACQ